jgi:hypothetical protein
MLAHPALARATALERLGRAEARRAAADARRAAKAARHATPQRPLLAQPVPAAEQGTA